MDELITIIIPIYNSEKYLKKCLDSIRSQTYPNLEILLLNDGSEDHSDVICYDYTSDLRFKLINKDHSGVSDTRNHGIDIANGEYIMFVDSDDYIMNNNYITELYNTMQQDQTKMIIAGTSIVRNQMIIRKEKYTKYKTVLNFNEIEDKFITTNYFNACYRSLINRKLLDDVRFDKTLRYSEDLLFMYEAIKKIGKFTYYPNCDYCYVEDTESALNNNIVEKQLKYLDNSFDVLRYIAGENKEWQEKAKVRMQEKYNYASIRLCIGKSYNEFKKSYIQLSDVYGLGRYDLSKSKESKLNKLRLYLLNTNDIISFYCLNKLIRWLV